MTLDFNDLGIVADDLTGACDVAACFAPRMGSVGVEIAPGSATPGGAGLRVINTQSRLLGGAAARDVLCRAGTALSAKQVVFKKIDAGLRGPLGADLAGLLEGLNQSGKNWSCVVAPAIPSIGRSTRGGIQYDHGIPVHQSALAHDPHLPPVSSDVRQVISSTGGGEYEVADAGTAEDLDRIVDAHLPKGCTVFAGSLGLARALAGRLRSEYHKPESGPPARRPMIVCGSRHPHSSRQVEYPQGEGIRLLSFDPAHGRFDSAIETEWTGPLLVRILPAVAAKMLTPADALLASFIEEVDLLRQRLKPDGLGIIGGETACQTLRRMGARRLEVSGQQAEVIAIARMCGGGMDGCRFVSKGGSVGPDDSVSQMLSLLAT